MTDVHNKQTRSRNMAAVKSKNTRPEIWLRKRLHARGFRYRLHVKDLPGKPDIVLPKYKAVIFVHGCFWHMHSCPVFRLPKTRTEWWYAKLQANHNRSQKQQKMLGKMGWRVLVVWECALKGRNRIAEEVLLSLASQWIRRGDTLQEIPPPSKSEFPSVC